MKWNKTNNNLWNIRLVSGTNNINQEYMSSKTKMDVQINILLDSNI